MTNPELENKLKELDDQSSYPSVTLILPFDNEDNLKDPDSTLKDLIKEVKKQLADLPDSPAFQTIAKKLNKLPVKLPPQNFYKAVVAFLSEDHEEIIPLDFAIEKKAYVGNSFDLKDIFRLNRNSIDENTETPEEKLKRIIIERYFQFRPYCKTTY